MNIKFAVAALVAGYVIATVNVADADGVIHQVPADGSWVRFDVTGAGVKPNGDVTTTLKGTITIKSVGREQLDGADCRWIELETEVEAQSERGPKSKRTETIKLLIPTKFLVTGQNPLEHVLKAWRLNPTDGTAVELELKGGGAREVKSLDEMLNGGLPSPEKREDVEVSVPGGTFRCTHLNGKGSSPAGDADLEIQTWLTSEVPFGVAAYRHAKTRKRGAESLGGRWMGLKLSKSGTDAKSGIPN